MRDFHWLSLFTAKNSICDFVEGRSQEALNSSTKYIRYHRSQIDVCLQVATNVKKYDCKTNDDMILKCAYETNEKCSIYSKL